MRAYNKFIKKVKKINIEVSEYRFLEGAGWVKAKDFDNLPNNLKKAYYWELESLNENKLKQLQSDAVNELSLLSDDQLKKTLKRLDFLNELERFNEFIKSFYVKVDNNTYNGLDVSDFKILLDKCFYVDVPNKGNISIDFLTELTDQIFLNSGLLDGLKWQIENLLTKQEQTKETDYWQDDADEITLISEYEKAVNKLIKGNDAGCFPMRFRMLPRVVLYENKYSIERKKYLLKQMRLVLDRVKNTEIGSELFTDLRQRVEPYEDIFSFVFSDTALPPQQTETKTEQDEVLSIQITHPKRTEIAKAIKDKYSSYKGKDFKILYEALLMLDLFPKKGKRSVFFRCLQNEGYNINNVQMLEDKHFKKGQSLKKTGKYHFTEDEKQRDEIIEYLKTIIETK